MNARTAQHLVLVTRRPVLGAGKRRLAAETDELTALRFQRWALGSLLRRLGRDARWRTWAAVTPDKPVSWLRGATPLPQGRGDLGDRLQRVLRSLPPGAAVFIGSDAPQVRPGDIGAAFRGLRCADAVVGPAPDGGYWLLGLSNRTRRASVFHNIRWSTEHALDDTLANLDGLRIRRLRTLEDVDDAASLRRLRSGV